MSENSERSGSAVKVGVLAGAIALGAGWCGAEPIARYFIGDAGEVPSAPEPPQPVEVHRDPINLAIGFDRTRSDIRHEFPRVVSVTRGFLERTGVLQQGDKVSACTFAEDASCRSFEMPGGKDALLAFVSGLRTEDPRPKMATYVQRSIRSILEQAGLANMADSKQGLALVWTDAVEEGDGVALQEAHAPVTIVVPAAKYLGDARRVAQELGDSVDAALAGDSRTFGSLLERRTGALEQEAQSRAQAEADARNRQLQADYRSRMEAYNQEKDGLEARKAAAEARIQRVKKAIMLTSGAVFAAIIGGLYTILRLRNRPRTYGYIVDARMRGIPKVIRLPSSVNSVVLNEVKPGMPQIVINAKKDGLYIGPAPIRDGMDISGDGCFWVEKQPDLRRLREFMKK